MTSITSEPLGSPQELEFWDQWFAFKGGRFAGDYLYRLNPTSLLSPFIEEYLSYHDSSILDVGAGPLTIIGKQRLRGQALAITPIDILANQYALLLKRYNIIPLVRTLQGAAEDVARAYPQNFFDVAYARNSLDHSRNPMEAITAMYQVTRLGGYVLLEHSVSEGSAARWGGMHQWDFYEEHEKFMIRSRSGEIFDVQDILKVPVTFSFSGEWFRVVIQRR